MIDPKALQKVMRSRGYNMKSLSRAAGLGETYVRDLIIEKVKSPSYENLTRLAAILDCSVEEITFAAPGDERVISRQSFDTAAKGLRASPQHAVDIDKQPDKPVSDPDLGQIGNRKIFSGCALPAGITARAARVSTRTIHRVSAGQV